jgi:glycosyltransferase involved in cell wall biosynthesis
VDDVRPDIARSQVYIVPLRIGGGTRLKIFEAMAMGRAVVSTTIGAEGLPVTSGRDIVIADEPEAFARAVVDLIHNHERRRCIAAAARQLVVDRYDWCAVADDLEQALTAVAGEPAGANLSHRPARHAILPTPSAIECIGRNQGPR